MKIKIDWLNVMGWTALILLTTLQSLAYVVFGLMAYVTHLAYPDFGWILGFLVAFGFVYNSYLMYLMWRKMLPGLMSR